MTEFAADIYEQVRKIPYGRVATYAQLAAYSNHYGACRAVGNVLHKNPEPGIIPCHRVVSSHGRLSKNFAFGGAAVQRDMLKKEGVEVSENFTVDLCKYLWRK